MQLPEVSKARGFLHLTNVKTWLVGVVSLSVAIATFIAWQSAFSQRLPNGGLILVDGVVELGQVWETDNHEVSFQIKNTSQSEVRILDFSASCTCVTFSPKVSTIPPNGQAAIHLTLDLSAKFNSDLLSTEREFKAEILPVIEDLPPIQRESWVVRGTVKKSAHVSGPAITFPGVLIRGEKFPTAAIQIRPVIKEAAPKVETNSSRCHATLFPIGVDQGTYRLAIELDEDLPIGSFSAMAKIKLSSVGDSVLSQFVIPIRAVVSERIIAVPTEMQLGTRQVGQTISEPVTLQSLTHKTFTVHTVDGVNDRLRIDPSANLHEPTSSMSLPILCQISAVGRHTTTINFIARDSADKLITIPVKVEYYGISSR